MATLAQQAVVSEATQFVSRVRMAMLDHARYQAGHGDDAHGYVTLAKAILAAPVGYGEAFARVVAVMPGVQDGIGTAPTTGEDVTDAQILSAVESIYPSFVR